MSRKLCLFAAAGLLATALSAGTPAFAQESHVKVGYLTCKAASG